ncbi:MAG: oligosaccharide flippase family protein, partial [Pseudomonadales bacterium]|nr:oligosaccharide flippase family protein [Pseudomonadales bacterium]
MKDTLENKSFLGKFLHGGVWALLVRSLTAISNFAISMIIARLLAPDQVGAYFLLVSFVSVAVSFTLLGLDVAIVRIIAKAVAMNERGVIRQSILKSRWMSLLSSFILALFLYFIGLELLSVHVFKNAA